MKTGHMVALATATVITLASFVLAEPAVAADGGIIQVRATGTTTAAPDTLELRLVVRQTAESLALASQRADEIVEEAVAALLEAGVEEESIDSSRFWSGPEYDWSRGNGRYLGESVERVIEINSQSIDAYGEILGRLSGLRLHRIDPPRFTHTNREQLELEALREAVRLARQKAETMAEAAGAEVGAVQSMIEEPAQWTPYMGRGGIMFESAALDAGSSGIVAPAMQLTEREIRVDIHVVYELLPGN